MAPARIGAIDWTAAASIATAGATLVLALATFASVRSANKAARAAERSLLAGIQPLLLQSRPQDLPQVVTWVDDHRFEIPGGGAWVEERDGVLYLAMSLRNAGNGLGLLHGWTIGSFADRRSAPPASPDTVRRLTRDLYVPANDIGFWQGAIRDADDPDRALVEAAARDGQDLVVDLLYGDVEGGQRTVTRFRLWQEEGEGWTCSASRHWYVDRADPR